jgi:glycosyltransferase involved in cell wall biosynthesis
LRGGPARLLLLVPHLAIGGADKFNLDLVEQLTQRGWEVTVATTQTGDHTWLPRLSALTPDVFALHRFLRPVDYPRFLRYLIQSRSVQVVILSHSELVYRLLPYLRSHAPQVTFLDYCHIEEEYWKNGGYPAMAVEHQPLLDLNIVSSRHLHDWMIRRGADAERIAICHTNIDSGQWTPDPLARQAVRHDLGIADQTPLILYAARLCEQKQPLVFAQTMLRLAERGVEYRALVAGKGPDSGRLERFVQKHQLTRRVSCLGAVEPERMRQLLAAADVFFLPSQWEGIALSIFEAMAAGLPVVSADVGGQRELVTPECGVLVPRGGETAEAERYAAVLAELLASPERRRAMGAAGRERVQAHFRLEHMGDRVVACLEQAQAYHNTQPRPRPDLVLGRVCARQAVEYMRLSELADQLWAERLGPLPAGQRRDWRVEWFKKLYRWHEPYYRWYSRRGWNWLTPVREAIKRLLLRRADQLWLK